MNKRFLYVVMVSAMVLCSACTGQTALEEENETRSDLSTVNETAAKETFDTVPETETTSPIESEAVPKTAEVSETPATSGTSDIAEIDTSDNPSRAKITFETRKDNDAAEDGTILYTNLCVYPVVTIKGNEAAAGKINAAIQTRVDAFLTDTSIRELAREDYQIYQSNEDLKSEYSFSGYDQNFDMIVTRNDSNVISFYITDSYYAGGPHGYSSSSGLNFNARTGELIAFSDLGENTETFHADTLDFLKELAATNTYQSMMWEDDGTSRYDLEQILYQDERWYFSTYGLVFFSEPYELGAFYAGNIEFTVPYADLNEMGLREPYSYHDNLTLKLQTEEICSFDLNGDGKEEEIRFYIDKPGSANTSLHFIINGTDYATEHAELSAQFSDGAYLFCWTQCFLYDRNPDDDITEIAFQMNYSDWGKSAAIPSIFLYRYEKDGSLTYLGKTEGTVTDPALIL